MKAPSPCVFCGFAVFGDPADEVIHPCCAAARAEGRGICITCLSAEEVHAARRAEAPPGEAIPVEAWDWPAIWRAEAEARKRIETMPLCRICGGTLTVGQSDAHLICVEEADAGIDPFPDYPDGAHHQRLEQAQRARELAEEHGIHNPQGAEIEPER